MNALQKACDTTIVFFTYENIDLAFGSYLRLGYDNQTMEESYDALCESMGLSQHPLRDPLSIYGEDVAGLFEEH